MENSTSQIFISYARVDNSIVSISDEEYRWVSHLVKNLENNISARLGRKEYVNFWFDEQSLDGNAFLNNELPNEISNSDIFLLVLTEGYLSSEWCMKELTIFLEKQQQNTNASNIFIVEKTNINYQDKPKDVADIVGFKFWYEDQESKQVLPYTHAAPMKIAYQYNTLVENLSTTIVKQIKMKSDLSTEETILKEKVFLGESTDDLEEIRGQVKVYLEDLGYDVYPKRAYSLNGDIFVVSSEEDIHSCTLFVQLLSNLCGKRPPDLEEGYQKAQYDVAKRLNVPVLQWANSTLNLAKIEDKIQQELLSTEHIVIGSIQNFKKSILLELKKLADQKRKKKLKVNKESSIMPFIFINATDEDDEIVQDLKSQLKDVCIVCEPIKQGLPNEIREDLQENLLQCEYYVLVYGKTNMLWINRQLRHYIKIGSQRKEDIKAMIIYHGPPKGKEKIPFSFPYLKVINNEENPNAYEVVEYIEKHLEGGYHA